MLWGYLCGFSAEFIAESLTRKCNSHNVQFLSLVWQESFSVLDSGIYRVISRRGSQSDEDSCSLHSQTFSEDERLKEFPAHHEDEQLEIGNVNKNMIVECVCLFYKKSTGLALCSYFPLSNYSLLIPVIWAIERVTPPSSQSPSWNIGLKSWLHRNRGLKADKTQRNKTKGPKGFTKHGLHSNFPLSMCKSTLMLRLLHLSMPVSTELQTSCLLPISFCNVCSRKEFLNLDSGLYFFRESRRILISVLLYRGSSLTHTNISVGMLE